MQTPFWEQSYRKDNITTFGIEPNQTIRERWQAFPARREGKNVNLCDGKYQKNWLFAYTPSGASASAFFYSLIETAKVNNLEPYWYLRYLFEKIMEAKTEEDYSMLLPQYVDRAEMREYRIPGKWG